MIEQTDVFISHAPPDHETADMLRCFLAGEGLCCTMSTSGAPATVGASGVMVLVFSNHANASASVREEVALAVTANIPIILFSTDDAPPNAQLESLLCDGFRIDAVNGPFVLHVPHVVCQVAKVLGRKLPGAKERDWRKTPPERYCHVKITVNPPGTHIRVNWPPPFVEGSSPLYLTTTDSWVEIEATMEGYEPRTFKRNIDVDSTAMDWCVGLRSLATAQMVREKAAAAKLGNADNPVEEVSGVLAEWRRQWDLLDMEWRRALENVSCDVCLGMHPGQPCKVGSITVVSRSDTCWVMDTDRYDRLMRLYEARVLSGHPAGFLAGVAAALRNRRACDPHFLPGFLADAIETLRTGLLGRGFGLVAPCFDPGDYLAEVARGEWYLFDGAAYSAFESVVRPLLPANRKSGQA